MTSFPAWEAAKWQEYTSEPIINPPEDVPVIGDPQVVLPGEFDGQWHMFYIGRGYLFHAVSPDGLAWKTLSRETWGCGPTCLTRQGGQWIIYYSHSAEPSNQVNTIKARTSKDLVTWSDPVAIIEPELAWEKEGKKQQVRNPWLVKLEDGRFRLYYCGGTIWMDDMDFEEPKYVGYAESASPFGPFKKGPGPILKPNPDVPHLNYGSGALKVYRFGGKFLGMANGIYLDKDRHSRSAIDVLLSDDGIVWEYAPYNPIISPDASRPWKAGLIYQLDLRWYQGKLWLFYNTREGWLHTREFMGLSRMDWQGTKPEKTWELKP